MTSSTNGPRPHSRLEVERELLFRRARSDPEFFITEFVKVNVVGKGYLPFRLWPHQPEIIEWMLSKHTDRASRSVALKARQIGWTTIGNAFALWSMLFHADLPWLQISVGQDEAAAALSQKLKTPYSMLPSWLRARLPQVVRDTGEEFTFDNGSGMLAVPSTSRSGRSRAVYGVLFDEAAFMENPEDVFAGIDPMCYGPLIVFSTANGMGNFFHSTWVEAMHDDSEWDSQFYPWKTVPGRDDAWFESKRLVYRGREHLLYQEYPGSAAEAFLKSGRTAFDLALLEETQPFGEPTERIDMLMFTWPDAELYELGVIPAGDRRDFELHVWERPYVEYDADGQIVRQPNYVIGVDVAEGLDHGDYSAISVRDANRGEQVATLRAHVPIYELGQLIETIAYWYHTALVGVERNSFGLVPLQLLTDHKYPRLYRMDKIAELKASRRTTRYGWLTSRTTKPKMVQDMAMAIAAETVTLHDVRFLVEASTFVSTGTGRYQAAAPNTDDLMIAELIAHQMQLDAGQYPVIWRDPKPGPLTFGDVFNIMAYADRSSTAARELEQPIGQSPAESKLQVSFPMRFKEDSWERM